MSSPVSVRSALAWQRLTQPGRVVSGLVEETLRLGLPQNNLRHVKPCASPLFHVHQTPMLYFDKLLQYYVQSILNGNPHQCDSKPPCMFIILCCLSQSHHGRCHHQHRHDAIIDVVFLHAVASSWMMFTGPAIVIQPRMKPNVLHSYITANPKPRALHLNRGPPIMDCAVGHAGLEKRHGQVGKDDLECVLGRLRPKLRLYEDANTVLKPHTFDSGSYLASAKPQCRILQALGHGWEHAEV